MNIIVCVKEIADPEAPSEDFRLDTDKNVLVASPKVLKVLNPFDEQAVEAALRIKDKVGALVTALSLGKGLDRVVTKKPVFMGADELILLLRKTEERERLFHENQTLARQIRQDGREPQGGFGDHRISRALP